MKKRDFFLLLTILVITAFFRLWQLNSIPPGLYPDEAINANDALESLKTKNFRVFYPENNGREGLFMWFLALSFSIFGISILSFKIVPAIIGILTIFGLYLFAKELFNKNVALLASFFLAISFWHVNFSRIGFRAILLPFILVFSFYFLFKALQTKKMWSFILAGAFFGLGFYTYTPFRMAILILPFILIPYWFIYKNEKLSKKFLSFVFYFLFSIFIVALPLGIYFLQNPHDFISRMTSISIFAAENPLKELGKSLIFHLGMFNFYGDGNWRHNFAGSPMLFWPIGILFLVGFFFSIKQIIDFPKLKNLSLVINHLTLIMWFFIMLLPGILTSEGIPHALRTIGVIPPVYIFVGLGSLTTFKFFEKNTKNKKLLFLTSAIFLLMVMSVQFNKYFLKWAKKTEVKNAFSKNYVEIGNYLNSLPSETQKYVIANMPGVPVPYPNGLPMPIQTIMFIERTHFKEPRSNYLLPKDIEKIEIEKETVIIPLKYEIELFDNLLEIFPYGKIKKENQILIFQIK